MNGGRQDQGQQDEQASEKIVLGRITGAYGVKGWVKVYSYTDPMESIVNYNPWYIRPQNRSRAPWKKVRLKAGKRHAKTVVAKLEHCNDRDQALGYIGYEIAIEPGQLEALQNDNEYYWRDLIGLRVVNRQQEELGVVKNLMETGVNDVLVVYSENDQRERLVPWTPGHAIDSVDLDSRVILVDWDADF